MTQPQRTKGPGLKADLHLHSRGGAHESYLGYDAFQLIDAAAQQAYDVCAVTNHDTVTWTSYLRDYAKERDIVLVPGLEVTLGRKHVLAYNVGGEGEAYKTVEDLYARKDRNTLFIAPHPFFPGPSSLGNTFFEWQTLFDAVELCHLYLSFMNFNIRAQAVAAQLQLPLVGTSDAHTLRQLGTTYSRIFAEKDPLSVIEAVKKGAVEVHTAPLSAIRISRILLELFARAAVHKLRAGRLRRYKARRMN